MGVSYVLAVYVGVSVCAHIPGSVSLHIWSTSLQVCVHCRRFVHIHTLTHTHKEKKTKPISLFQTHQWSSWGSLVQSKATILKCRREPVESWNLSRRLLTWQHKTVGFARIIYYSDLQSGGQAEVKCHPLAGDYFIQSGNPHLSFFTE